MAQRYCFLGIYASTELVRSTKATVGEAVGVRAPHMALSPAIDDPIKSQKKKRTYSLTQIRQWFAEPAPTLPAGLGPGYCRMGPRTRTEPRTDEKPDA
jgi:hypothetical protein